MFFEPPRDLLDDRLSDAQVVDRDEDDGSSLEPDARGGARRLPARRDREEEAEGDESEAGRSDPHLEEEDRSTPLEKKKMPWPEGQGIRHFPEKV